MQRTRNALAVFGCVLIALIALSGCSGGPVRGVSEQPLAPAPPAPAAAPAPKSEPRAVPLEPVEVFAPRKGRFASALGEVVSAEPYGMLSPMSASAHLQVARYERSPKGFALVQPDYSADAYRACIKARAKALRIAGPDGDVRVVLAAGWAFAVCEDAGGLPVACVYRAFPDASDADDMADGAVLRGRDALRALDRLARW